jgi:hypothetical protein
VARSPYDADRVPLIFSLEPGDFVMILTTPPRDEPHADDAGPFMISILSIIWTGMSLAIVKFESKYFKGTPSRKKAT